jgi:hypothetical protein
LSTDPDLLDRHGLAACEAVAPVLGLAGPSWFAGRAASVMIPLSVKARL